MLAVTLCLTLIAGGTTISRQEEGGLSKSSLALYTSVAGAIDEVQGRMILKLRPGTYSARLGNVNVRWTPTYNSQIFAKVFYAKGGLVTGPNGEKPELDFRPAVEISAANDGSPPVFLRRAVYDADGTPDLDFVDASGRPTTPGFESMSLIAAVMELDRKPSSFFLGQPFKIKSTLVGSPSNDPSKSGPIQRLRFAENIQAGVPGLAAKFRKSATITFSEGEANKTSFRNSVKLSSTNPGGFTFKELDYWPLAGKADCHLQDLEVGLASGRFSVGKVQLEMQAGGALSLDNVIASSDLTKEKPNMQLDGGELKAVVGDGTILRVNSLGDDFYTDLRFGDGSNVELNDFAIQISEGRLSKLECKSLSAAKVVLREDSTLAINDHTKFVLRSGDAKIKLENALWETGVPQPNLKGEITSLNVDAKYAMMPVTIASTAQSIEFDKAAFASTRLLFDTKDAQVVEGDLSSLNLELRPGTRVVMAPRTVIQVGNGATLKANDPNKPLRFVQGSDWPLGRYALDIPEITGGTITPGAAATLVKGQARFYQENMAGRTMTSYQDGYLRSELLLQAKQGSVGLGLNAESARLNATNGNPVLSGNFSATLKPSTAGSIVVGKHEQKGRTWMFPVTLNVSVAAEVPLFSGRPLVIDINGLRQPNGSGIQTTVPIQLRVQVPKGAGEYKKPDKPEEGGKNDDDEYRDKQEVLRYDAVDPLGVFHIYADQGIYSGTAQLTLTYSPGASNPWRVRASNFGLDQNVVVTQDGLDGLAAILDALLGAWGAIRDIVNGIFPGDPLSGDAARSSTELVNRVVNKFLRNEVLPGLEVGN